MLSYSAVLERPVIMRGIAYHQILFAIFQRIGQHPRFAFVHAGPGAGPVRFVCTLLVFGKAELAHFQFATAPETGHVPNVEIWNGNHEID